MDDIDRERYRSNPREGAPGSLGGPVLAAVSRRPLWLQFETSSEPTGWFLNLVLLVVLCIVVMAIATAGLRQWRPAPVGPATPLVVVAQNAERAAIRTDLAISDEIEKQARLKVAQQAEERRQAAIRDREAEEEAAQRTAALEARWEREWRAYYNKPAHCEESQPDVDSVGCANDYIRARRAFDEKFAASARRR